VIEQQTQNVDYIVTVDEANAAQVLIHESQQRPVVIDFWADWCGPCKTLMPLLEKLAHEYNGAFVLAKVNADEQGMIAQQFGVRSLPTVMIMQNGQPVDGFVGAQPEPAIREMLQKYLPSPWEGALETAQQQLAGGDAAAAVATLRPAYKESGKATDVAIAYAHALVEAMRLDEAEAVLAEIPMVEQDAAYEQVAAQLKIKRESARSPEIDALEQKLAADPDNNDVRAELALQYSNAGQFRESLEALMTILQQDVNHADGATKKTLLDTIASLGKGDPLAVEYQRKLFSLLY
jgi:putative thioredoxin